MSSPVVGVWFRKCLRLHDNFPLLKAAEIENAEVMPFFVLDTDQFTQERFSANRFRFLFEALQDLDSQLKARFGAKTHGLVVFRGQVERVIESLCKGDNKVLPKPVRLTHLLYEFDSGPYGRERDKRVSNTICQQYNVAVESFSGHTILDLEKCKASEGNMPTSMSMIQQLVKKQLGCTSVDKLDKVPKPKPAPTKLGKLPFSADLIKSTASKNAANRLTIPVLGEMGYSKNSFPKSEKLFPGGETAGLKRLAEEIEEPGQKGYVCSFEKPKTSSTNVRKGDDWTTPSTTGLSPYLAQGSLSVRQVWHAIQKVYDQAGPGKHSKPPMSLHGQLLFREQFYVLGYCVENFHLPTGNAMCKDIEWDGGSSPNSNGSTLSNPKAKARLKAWQEGVTGYPLIDAFMRQLVATGWMHHLGRHAVSCFLTRGDLYLSWVHGRDFFDKHLLDGDWAINNANWLWLAGVAPFSMPFFRVYSPMPPVKGPQSALNCEQTGDFVRFWVPELKNVPTQFIYQPWKMSSLAQMNAKCTIGKDYPKPIVDHNVIKEKNLSAFKASSQQLSKEKVAFSSSGTKRTAKEKSSLLQKRHKQ